MPVCPSVCHTSTAALAKPLCPKEIKEISWNANFKEEAKQALRTPAYIRLVPFTLPVDLIYFRFSDLES
jgi:hypothetical protein